MENTVIKEILSYLLIIVLAILIKLFVFSPIRVNGESMMPTLHDGDIMILNEFGKYFHDFKRFDIVVVKTENDKIIKRIIGLPGDKVEYKDNKLYINDELVPEEFTHEVTHNFTLSEIGEDIIPEGYYFVVGDNRGNSKDSRIIGLIDKKQIMGTTKIIIFPFSRIGLSK